MSHSKPLFIPWLRAQIDSGKYPGVTWTNPEQTEFSIPWKHALRKDSSSVDVLIFKAWAEVSGNGKAQGDSSVWKRNFRSALRAKKFQMLTDNKNDVANPHKMFRWPDEAPSGETIAVFEPPPEQQQQQPLQGVIGGVVLPEQQQYPVVFEGAVGGVVLPEQPAYPIDGAAGGGACDQQMVEHFVDTIFKTMVGDHFKTEFKVLVYYRGEKVSEQLVMNEDRLRLVYRPELSQPVLDQESGLLLVSLPKPRAMLDQTQASLTQRILDKLGEGLEVGVSGPMVYGQRRGEIKAYWSLCKFDRSKRPQEVSKLEPQPLYLFKDFVQGLLDFIKGKDCPSCSLFFCLGEKWPCPDGRPWEKKLIMVEVVKTSLQILKNLAVGGGASSLQSVELKMSLEEMMEWC
ncbi:interferon regulatory factor 3 [Diretmus argenteus]